MLSKHLQLAMELLILHFSLMFDLSYREDRGVLNCSLRLNLFG